MIAVTGAAGFIGSNLAQRLAKEGHELLLVDHPLTSAKAANLLGLKSFRFLEHDSFLTSLESNLSTLEAIFHLGACSSTTESNWDYLKRNNIEYSQQLWHHCAMHRLPLIYASSAATYGDGTRGFDDRTLPTQLQPLNLYGTSKNEFDRWALEEQSAGRPQPSSWAGVKFFNVYGPRETHKGRMTSVVYQTWRQVRATGEMKLFRSSDPQFTDGEQQRDFVFVEDCIQQMLWLWNRRPANGLYNSGTATPRTFLDLARNVFHALGREPRISFIDMPADLVGKYQNFTRAEMSKSRQAGYPSPVTSLEEGVHRTVHWLESIGT